MLTQLAAHTWRPSDPPLPVNILGYRLGSVLCGTTMICIAWRLGLRQFGPTVGLGVAVFAAFNHTLLGILRFATQESAYPAASAAAVLVFCRRDQQGEQGGYVYVGVFSASDCSLKR